MAEFSFKQLQEEHSHWLQRNFGEPPTWNFLLGVVEELGELAHSHLKECQNIRTTENHMTNAQDAVGDIVVYLAGYCTARGWDLGTIVERTWDGVKQRDWKADPENAGGVSSQELGRRKGK